MHRYTSSNELTGATFNRHFEKDTAFAQLMKKRVYNVLLIANRYDAFILEDDGRINEKIFNEYTSLNLRYPPRFTLVGHNEDTATLLQENHFDLIISMPGTTQNNTFEGAKEIKQMFPHIPIVVLTPFSQNVSQRIAHEDLSAIDYVFSWLGNPELLVAIIKLIEDRMNAQEDCQSGVRTLLVVEDSIRFYSSILPHLYTYIFRQSRSFMTEALNEHQRMLRMRGRPKVLLARSYEEAMVYYNQYGQNLLGLISDVSFLHNHQKDSQAGLELCRKIRQENPHLPIIINSSEQRNEEEALKLGAIFISKLSKTLPIELRSILEQYFGFGDLVFKDGQGNTISRVSNLIELQHCIFDLSGEALWTQMEQNSISRWLYSRALFPLAGFLEDIKVTKREEVDKARQLIFEAIVRYRRTKNRGIIAVFQRDRFDQYAHFARIGEGSMGGKARALAFMDASIKSGHLQEKYPDIHVSIPRTVVFCTDIFEEFLARNEIDPTAESFQQPAHTSVLNQFLRGKFSAQQEADILALAQSMDRPIIVRSSVHPEPQHWNRLDLLHPHYMIPFVQNGNQMSERLGSAIKAIFASMFYTNAKGQSAVSENQKHISMAVMVQELFGTQHYQDYYPALTLTLSSDSDFGSELRQKITEASQSAHSVAAMHNTPENFALEESGSGNYQEMDAQSPELAVLIQQKPSLIESVCKLTEEIMQRATEDMQKQIRMEIAIDPAIEDSGVLAYRVLKVY